jgi:hypothetical protein
MFRPELPHQFRHAPEFTLRLVRVESLAQVIGGLLGFELQQHVVEQRELLAVHPLDFLVQDGLELLRRNRRGGLAAFHAGTIHPQNPPDKGGPNNNDSAEIQRKGAKTPRRKVGASKASQAKVKGNLVLVLKSQKSRARHSVRAVGQSKERRAGD